VLDPPLRSDAVSVKCALVEWTAAPIVVAVREVELASGVMLSPHAATSAHAKIRPRMEKFIAIGFDRGVRVFRDRAFAVG
jgi:hypothetical protein